MVSMIGESPSLFSAELFAEEPVSSVEQGISLPGGLSERNKLLEGADGKYVVHNIETPAELYMMIEAAKAGVAPKILGSSLEEKWALMEYIEGRTITPEIAKLHCKEIGSGLKKAHGIPLFQEKGKGFERANLERWEYIQKEASRYETELSASLLEGGQTAMEVFEKGMSSLSDAKLTVNVHTDLHARNLFWTDRGLLIIDWESSSHGHPYFDLASLSIFLGFDEAQEKELLEGYFGAPPTADQLREYGQFKTVQWAYTCMVNTMWAYRVLAKEPTSEPIAPPDKSFSDYMQLFAETDGLPTLEFFVNVSRLALEKI